VPKKHFEDQAWGRIRFDRFSSYQTWMDRGLFLVSFCSEHGRRDVLA